MRAAPVNATDVQDDPTPEPRFTGVARSRRVSVVNISGAFIGIAAILGIWAFISRRQPELILPSPTQTWDSIIKLWQKGVVGEAMLQTLVAALIGVLIAFAIGALWGTANGTSRWFTAITQPLLSALMAIPPVLLVALGVVWLGPRGSVVRLVVVLVALPLIVTAISEAVRDVDSDLVEMARSFNLSRWATARHVVLPSVVSPVLAATSVTVGQALRVVVMAELLSGSNGVGAQVALARTNLQTADLFAWTIMLVVVVLVIEAAAIRPLTNYLLRWRVPSR